MVNTNKKKSPELGISGLNSISNLEADIMQIVWEAGQISVREVHEIMLKREMENKEHGFIPYTTVMSTMTTLSDKGLLKQNKAAKTYLYSASVDRKELSKNIIMSVAEKLLDSSSNVLVSKFVTNEHNISVDQVKKLLNDIK